MEGSLGSTRRYGEIAREMGRDAMFMNRTVDVGENCAKLESRLERSATFCGLSGSGPVVDAVSGTGEVAGGSKFVVTGSISELSATGLIRVRVVWSAS